jgi:hypothetical protein
MTTDHILSHLMAYSSRKSHVLPVRNVRILRSCRLGILTCGAFCKHSWTARFLKNTTEDPGAVREMPAGKANAIQDARSIQSGTSIAKGGAA